MTAAVIRRLQAEAEAWRVHNYGSCQPWEQLLGAVEELGESYEGIGDNAEFEDSIGDSAIYLLNFCTSMKWDAGELYELRDLYEQPSRPWPILVGRLAHHYVKGFVQNYRGTREEHEARAKASASALFATWEKLCAGMGTTFLETLEKTWAEVAARDWTKVRAAPGKAESRVFEGVAIKHEEYWAIHSRKLSMRIASDDHCWLDGLHNKCVRLTVEALDDEAKP